MKIIEALKQIKDIQRKAEDIRGKVSECSARMSFESDKYENQKEKMNSWLQGHHDLVLEIGRLRERIAKTNINTIVSIEIDGKMIEKSIHSWISRRRDLASLDRMVWEVLTDKSLRDQQIRATNNSSELVEFKVVRFYDPSEKDKMIDRYKSEVMLIDGKLEIINAITDLEE